MPNWIFNSVIITGDENSVKTVRKILKGESDFDFNEIIPMPHRLLIHPESRPHLDLGCRWRYCRARNHLWFMATFQSGLPSSEEWCSEHWGTKWNACYVDLGRPQGNQAHYRFGTVGSAPRHIAEELRLLCADLGLSVSWTARDEYNSGWYSVLQ